MFWQEIGVDWYAWHINLWLGTPLWRALPTVSLSFASLSIAVTRNARDWGATGPTKRSSLSSVNLLATPKETHFKTLCCLYRHLIEQRIFFIRKVTIMLLILGLLLSTLLPHNNKGNIGANPTHITVLRRNLRAGSIRGEAEHDDAIISIIIWRFSDIFETLLSYHIPNNECDWSIVCVEDDGVNLYSSGLCCLHLKCSHQVIID